MRIVIVSAMILLAGAACASDKQDAGHFLRWKTFPVLDKEQCLAKGGRWGVLGMVGAPYPPKCNLSTTDAEKVCSQPEDCQGYCMYDQRIGSAVEGRCSAKQEQLGCRDYVQDGQILSICSD